MKYVVLESSDGLRLFVFPALIEYDAARTLRKFGPPVRAGLVRRMKAGFVCGAGPYRSDYGRIRKRI